MIETASVTSTHLIDGVFIGANVGPLSFYTISFVEKSWTRLISDSTVRTITRTIFPGFLSTRNWHASTMREIEEDR
jgi:hypothetical protein